MAALEVFAALVVGSCASVEVVVEGIASILLKLQDNCCTGTLARLRSAASHDLLSSSTTDD